MDVRKWLTTQLTSMQFLGEYGAIENLPLDYADEIADTLEPKITKLVDALRDVAIGLHELDSTYEHEHRPFENCTEWHCAKARAVLEELEKP